MLGLLLGAFCIGFAPILVKLIDAGPTQIAVFRVGFAAVILLPWLVTYVVRALRKGLPVWEPRVLGWLFLASLAFASDLYCWHRTVIYLGAGLGTILANTQSLYLAALGALFFSEKLNKVYFLSLVVAAAGIYALVGEIPEWVQPEHYGPGLFYGLLTGLFYSVFLISLRQAERIRLGWKSLEKLSVLCLITTGFLIPLSMASGEWSLPDSESLQWALVLALGPQVLGWYLISSNLPKLDVSLSGLALLTQPVWATLWGALLFEEHLTLTQTIGAVATLLALWMAQLSKKRAAQKSAIAL